MTHLLLLALVLATTDAVGEQLYLEGIDLRVEGDLDGAAERFQRAADEYADSPFAPGALLVWAEIAQEQGDDAAAEALYRRLLETYPSHRLAGNAETRLREIERRSTLDPVEARYEELLEGVAEQDTATTIATVEGLLEQHPDHPIAARAECWLGNQARQSADFSAAIEHYRRSLDIDPTSGCARRALDHTGNVALDQGQLGLAGEAFTALAEHGELGEAAAAHHLASLRHARILRAIWVTLGLGAVAALLLLAVGTPWRELRRVNLAGGLTSFTVVLAGSFLWGATGDAPLRTLLVLLGPALALTAGIFGVLRAAPRYGWFRAAWRPAIGWLAVTAIYGCLYTLDRL